MLTNLHSTVTEAERTKTDDRRNKIYNSRLVINVGLSQEKPRDQAFNTAIIRLAEELGLTAEIAYWQSKELRFYGPAVSAKKPSELFEVPQLLELRFGQDADLGAIFGRLVSRAVAFTLQVREMEGLNRQVQDLDSHFSSELMNDAKKNMRYEQRLAGLKEELRQEIENEFSENEDAYKGHMVQSQLKDAEGELHNYDRRAVNVSMDRVVKKAQAKVGGESNPFINLHGHNPDVLFELPEIEKFIDESEDSPGDIKVAYLVKFTDTALTQLRGGRYHPDELEPAIEMYGNLTVQEVVDLKCGEEIPMEIRSVLYDITCDHTGEK